MNLNCILQSCVICCWENHLQKKRKKRKNILAKHSNNREGNDFFDKALKVCKG